MRVDKKTAIKQLKDSGAFLLITIEEGDGGYIARHNWGKDNTEADCWMTMALLSSLEVEKHNIIHSQTPNLGFVDKGEELDIKTQTKGKN